MSRRLRLLLAALGLAGLTACGGDEELAAEDVADGVEQALEVQVGARPDISCPDDLAAEVGATTRCTLGVDGDPEEYGVTVTVTSVDGDTANFDIEVDEEPLG